jgi:hypothetical protein
MTNTRTAIVLATTVSSFSALAGVAAMPTAHAFPLALPEGPCDSWHLKDSALTINVGDPGRSQISINWDANSGTSPSTAETNARWSESGTTATGNANGNGGPTSVDLSFNWTGTSGDGPAHFTGNIDPQFGSVRACIGGRGVKRAMPQTISRGP